MPLGKLQKELYKKDASLPEHKPDAFRPERERFTPSDSSREESRGVEEPQKEWRYEEPPKPPVFFTKKLKKYLIWTGLGIALVGFIIFIVWGSWAFRSFDKSKVRLGIDVPKTIESGEKLSLVVNYYNNNKVTLKNVKLNLEYPKDSLPLGEGFSEPTYFFTKTVSIGDIAPRGNGRLEFPALIFGSLGEEKEIKIRLTYMPENFTSPFENEYLKTFTVESIPLSLDWHFTGEAVSGQEFEAKLSFISSSNNDFHNLRIDVEYPSGFTFESADPPASEGQNVWDFEKIAPAREQNIIIKGRLTGLAQEQKPFKARLGIMREKNGIREFVLYDELQAPTKIVSSPLFITQNISNLQDNTVNAGNVLRYKIGYKNTTSVGIERVEVAVELSGDALDFTSLKIERGSFDSFRKMISWKGGESPELNILSPNESGEFTFSITVKNPLPIEKFSDKNFTIQSKATINSLSIPSSLSGTDIKGEDILVLKVASNIDLRQKGYYFESPISNSGPIPPRVGESTTYNIIWQVTNTSNDIENVKVESYLPAYVSWQGQIEPKGADIFYDNTTRKITWNLGKLPAQTGILLPVKQVAFQVSLVPSLNHLGKELDLIGEAQISGKDAFTEKSLQDFSPVVMTSLPDDPFVKTQDGRVVQ